MSLQIKLLKLPMEALGNKLSQLILNVLTLSLLFHVGVALPIGVNYGTVANDLPPPAKVSEFLKTKTTVDKVKMFDANPDIIRGFANSGIGVSIMVPNGQIPGIMQLPGAKDWVKNNVSPFLPQTNIIRVLVGNEILHWEPNNAINLVPAMRSLHQALQEAGHKNIQVSTPHSLGILGKSDFPSAGKFRPGIDKDILAPMLQFLRDTKAPFIVNPYPYFDTRPDNVDFCTFKPNKGKLDLGTKINYMNQFDWLMDTTFSAMKALGFADVPIVAGETGWPAVGEPGQTWVNVETAQFYNSKLIEHVNSGIGTPLMPKKRFETYIFGLFTENLKPGPIAERNFGLFRPDFTPVYDVGIMKGGPPPKPLPQPQPAQPLPQPGKPLPQPAQPLPQPGKPLPQPAQPQPVPPRPVLKPEPKPLPVPKPEPKPEPEPVPGQPQPDPSRQWCVPKKEATDVQMQANIDYACGQGAVDCSPIKPAGHCFTPGNVRAHASFAMNAYYQTMGHQPAQCDFKGTGLISNLDPSFGPCKM